MKHLTVVAAAILAILTSACTSTTDSTAASGSAQVQQTAHVYPVGQMVNAKSGNNEAQITVSNVRKVEPSDPDDTKAKTDDFYAATVTITTTKGTWAVNPLYYNLYGADGSTGSDFVMAAGVHELDTTDLPVGATVKGDVVKSLPKGQTVQRVTTTDPMTTVIATWKVK